MSSDTAMLIRYEQLFIQIFHHNGKFIPEKCSGEPNPLLQLTIDTSLKSRPSQNKPTPPTSASETSSNSTTVM
jgi:hypothetical protein